MKLTQTSIDEEPDELDKVMINPFDFSFASIKGHRKVYVQNSSSHPTAREPQDPSKFIRKGAEGANCQVQALAGGKKKEWWNNCIMTNKQTLEKVFQDLVQKIPKLAPEKWRHILRELDQSVFEVIPTNLTLKDHVARVDVLGQSNLSEEGSYKPKNLAESLDLELLAQKIHFTDFLKVLQRESVLREILSEHQLYYHSTKRLFYKQETKLITKQALDAIHANKGKKQSQAKAFGQLSTSKEEQQAKQKEAANIVKVPTVTYLIDQMLMFEFQGTHMLLVALENQTVQVFDAKNGHFIHEFSFFNNVLNQLKHQNKQLMSTFDKKNSSPKRDQSLDNTSNDSQQDQHTTASINAAAEALAMKRKAMRDNGIFECPIPKYRKVVKMLGQFSNKGSPSHYQSTLMATKTTFDMINSPQQFRKSGENTSDPSYPFLNKITKLTENADLNLREQSEEDSSLTQNKASRDGDEIGSESSTPDSEENSKRSGFVGEINLTRENYDFKGMQKLEISEEDRHQDDTHEQTQIFSNTGVNHDQFWNWVNDLDISHNIRRLEMSHKNRTILSKTLKKMNIKQDSFSPGTPLRSNLNQSSDHFLEESNDFGGGGQFKAHSVQRVHRPFSKEEQQPQRGRTPQQPFPQNDLIHSKSIFDDNSFFDETGKRVLANEQPTRNIAHIRTQEVPRKTVGFYQPPNKNNELRPSLKSKKTVNIVLDESESGSEEPRRVLSSTFSNIITKKNAKMSQFSKSKIQSSSHIKHSADLLKVSNDHANALRSRHQSLIHPKPKKEEHKSPISKMSGSLSESSKSSKVHHPVVVSAPGSQPPSRKAKAKPTLSDNANAHLMMSALKVKLGGNVGNNMAQSSKKFAKQKAEKHEQQDQKNFQKVLDMIQGTNSDKKGRRGKSQQPPAEEPANQQMAPRKKMSIIESFQDIMKITKPTPGEEEYQRRQTSNETTNSRENEREDSLKPVASFTRRGTFKSMDKKHIQKLLEAESVSPNLLKQSLDQLVEPGQKELFQKELLLKQRMDARKRIQEQQKKNMAKKKQPNGGYKILGLDPIMDSYDKKAMQQQSQQDSAKTQSVFDHYTTLFGMHENMFTPDPEKKEREDTFISLLRKLTQQINFNSKLKSDMQALRKQAENVKKKNKAKMNASQKNLFKKPLESDSDSHSSKGSDASKDSVEADSRTLAQFIAKNKRYEPNKRVTNYLQHLRNEKNVLWNRLGDLKQRQGVFSGWIRDFDSQQRQDLGVSPSQMATPSNTGKESANLKQVAMARKAMYSSGKQSNLEIAQAAVKQRRELKAQESKNNLKRQDSIAVDQDLQVLSKSRVDGPALSTAQLLKGGINSKMMHERVKRLKQYEKQQRIEQDEKKNLRKIEEKRTYPLRMAYYEPENLSIFALVTREIQIHQLKQTGVKYKFSHLQSLKVESIVESMSIARHRVSNNLIICLGTQCAKSFEKSEVVIFELDTKNDCEVVDSYRWIIPFKQVTNIIYRVGCGLVVTSFNGIIEIYDSKNINHLVWSNTFAPQKQLKECGSISALDYSEELDILAFGGVSGAIHFIDQTTKKHNGVINAHVSEIIMLKFYDQQHQLISVTTTGDVGLWDSQKMTKYQILKNAPYMLQKCISSCCFYEPLGKIMMATSRIFNYELSTDFHVKVHVDQQNAIARDYLRDFFNQLKQCGFIDENPPLFKRQEDPQITEDKPTPILPEKAMARRSLSLAPGKQRQSHAILMSQKTLKADSRMSKRGSPKRHKRGSPQKKPFVIPSVSEKEYLQGAYKDSTLKDFIPPEKEYNKTVLPSDNSKLISTIIDTINTQVYTIDCDLMVRIWCLKTGQCLRSYMLETRMTQIQQLNEGLDVNQMPSTGADEDSKFSKKAQLAQADELLKFLIVCFEGGQIQINNLYSGALIYNNCNVEPLKLEHEVAAISFFPTQTKYWIAASCFDGKVAFISIPMVSQGRSYLKYMSSKCSHYRDVLTLDINSDNQLVTGSIDNVLCFWNSFSGTESKKFIPPDEIACSYKGQKIVYVKFPFQTHKDLLMIVLNTGNCYILETQSEKFLEFPFAKGLDIEEIPLDSSMSVLPEKSSQLSVADKKMMWTKKPQKSTNKLQQIQKNYVMARISKDPIIELKNDVLISLNDNGQGFICELGLNVKKSNPSSRRNTVLRPSGEHGGLERESTLFRRSRLSTVGRSHHMYSNLINFEVKNQFTINSRILDRGGCFINILISEERNIFLTSQQNGQVIAFSLKTGDRLSFLNSQHFTLQPQAQRQTRKSKLHQAQIKELANLEKSEEDEEFEEQPLTTSMQSDTAANAEKNESSIFKMLQQKGFKRGNSLFKIQVKKEEGEIDLLKGLKYQRKSPVNLNPKKKQIDSEYQQLLEPSKKTSQPQRKSKRSRRGTRLIMSIGSATSLQAKQVLSDL